MLHGSAATLCSFYHYTKIFVALIFVILQLTP